MSDLPYFKWYPAEAEADALYASMTDQELGFYHRCLNRSWTNEGLPADMVELARVMRVSPTYLRKVWERVGRCFIQSEDIFVNPRQEKERLKAQTKSEKAADAGRKGQRSLKRLLKVRRPVVPLRASDSGSESDCSEMFVSEITSDEEKQISEMWKAAEFESSEHFETWFLDVYANHPTRGELQIAQDLLRKYIFEGRMTRTEFEAGYAAWKVSAQWLRENGRYVPKLSIFAQDMSWKFPPKGIDDKEPPMAIEDQYGRRDTNPEWLRWRDRQAKGRAS